MKRTRERYENGDEEQRDRLVVNQAALCALMRFFDSDPIVQACRNTIDESVFEGRYTFSIGDPEKGVSAKRPSLFNTSFYLQATRNVQKRARDHINAYGGCAFWAIKNQARWLQRYVNAPDDCARRDLGLPYGVLEVWEYSLELERQQATGRHFAYRVTPYDRRNHGEHVYFFYDHSVTLLPLDESKLTAYERRGASYIALARQLGSSNATMHGAGSGQDRVPQSPFHHIADMHDELEQVKTNLLDADWLVAHPKAILRAAVPQSEAEQNNLPDSDLFTGRSIIEQADKLRRRRATMSLQQMADLISSVRQVEGVHAQHHAPRQQQRRHYRYCDMLDDAELWDETAELVHWAEPTVLNNYSSRFEEYKIAVLTAMGVSEGSRFAQALLGRVAAREASGLGGRSHIAMLVDRDERNAQAESEQRIHARVFEVVYDMCGFSRHDAFAVSELVERLDALITEEEIRRTAVRNLQRLQQQQQSTDPIPLAPASAAKHMLRVEEEEKKKKRETSEEESGDVILSKLRITVADMRAWLKQTQRQPEKMSLIFESKDANMIKLQFYQEMRGMGLVSVEELERQARKVYNDDLHLQEPPAPEKPRQ